MTEIPGMVERVAEAIYETTLGDEMLAIDWIEATAEIATRRRAEARAAIAALVAALRDAGMVIVPREPTFEMGLAGGDVVVDFDSDFRMPDSHARAMWRAMVAAAHSADVSK